MTILFTFYYVGEWIIRVAMLCVVSRRRRPDSAMAWLVLVFAVPWIGLLLYLWIGRPRAPERRLRKHMQLEEHWKEVGARFEGHPNIVNPDIPDREATIAMIREMGGGPILGGNTGDLIQDTDEQIERLVADIDAAENHVHLLFYIYVDDATGRRVAAALRRAVERGVTCRLLVDALGSRRMLKGLGRQLQRDGIEVRAALPVNLLRRLERIDLRNHRKLAVIDGRIAHTGSRNLVDAGYGRDDMAWRDLVARLTGPTVLPLQAVFIGDWYMETGELLDGDELLPSPTLTGDIPVQVLPSGPVYYTENYQRLLVSALHRSREHVIITTPYFVPDQPFLQAVETAVLRGVKVEIIVPKRADQIIVGNAQKAYYEYLLDYGAELHLHTDGLLHAKTMLVDERLVLFGTSNFDIRSFALNFELNLIFYGEREGRAMRQVLDTYISQSERLTAEVWAQRSVPAQIGQNIAKLISPLL